MSLFRTIVFVAAAAGLFSGIAMTAFQQAATVPLILKAETYEEAEPAAPAAHTHDAATPAHSHDSAAAHSHDEGGWQPADGFERMAFTLAANIVGAIGFALLLVAASELAGGLTGWRDGLLWGLAGFAAFTLAPSLGLPPELPAMPAAELGPRQLWWTATAVATAGGIALIAYGRSLPAAIAALALIAAPHFIGAPQPESFETPVPHDLAHNFVVAVVVTSFLFWAILGGVAGLVRARMAGAQP